MLDFGAGTTWSAPGYLSWYPFLLRAEFARALLPIQLELVKVTRRYTLGGLLVAQYRPNGVDAVSECRLLWGLARYGTTRGFYLRHVVGDDPRLYRVARSQLGVEAFLGRVARVSDGNWRIDAGRRWRAMPRSWAGLPLGRGRGAFSMFSCRDGRLQRVTLRAHGPCRLGLGRCAIESPDLLPDIPYEIPRWQWNLPWQRHWKNADLAFTAPEDIDLRGYVPRT